MCKMIVNLYILSLMSAVGSRYIEWNRVRDECTSRNDLKEQQWVYGVRHLCRCIALVYVICTLDLYTCYGLYLHYAMYTVCTACVCRQSKSSQMTLFERVMPSERLSPCGRWRTRVLTNIPTLDAHSEKQPYAVAVWLEKVKCVSVCAMTTASAPSVGRLRPGILCALYRTH